VNLFASKQIRKTCMLMPYNTRKLFIIFFLYSYQTPGPYKTSSSAIAERPRCKVGQFWSKVEDDILQTI